LSRDVLGYVTIEHAMGRGARTFIGTGSFRVRTRTVECGCDRPRSSSGPLQHATVRGDQVFSAAITFGMDQGRARSSSPQVWLRWSAIRTRCESAEPDKSAVPWRTRRISSLRRAGPLGCNHVCGRDRTEMQTVTNAVGESIQCWICRRRVGGRARRRGHLTIFGNWTLASAEARPAG